MVKNRTHIGIAAALVAVCALIAAVAFPGARLASLALAVTVLLVASSLLSTAGGLSTQLADLKGRSVSIQISGAAYVQWAARRVSRREGTAALELSVREPRCG